MPLRVGDLIEVLPEKLVAGGEALARVEGLPVFVAGIYPGDRATVRVIEAKKGFARGELVDLLVAGPLRREDPCPIARTCGGCDWTELRLDKQLEAKKEILLEALRRIGKIETTAIPPIEMHVSPLNYRLRSRLHVDVARRAVGFAMRSHDVIDLSEECEVVGPAVIDQLAEIKRLAIGAARTSVSLFETPEQLIVDAHDEEETASGVERTINVEGHDFNLSSSSFFQVNRHLLASLLRAVRVIATRNHDRSDAFDLYGGVGFFEQPLAELFGQVTSVESSTSSL
jgi:23S rRNA (uracil1939-C5)-methyltransferase